MKDRSKIIIIEGIDNSGKDTLISGILSKSKLPAITYHFEKPTSDDPIFAALEQKESYLRTINSIKQELQKNKTTIVLNRSWYGEYVYGCLYRGNGDKFVASMIEECDELINKVASSCNADVSFFLLMNDSVELALKNDDGLSIRNDGYSILREADRFVKAYKMSNIKNKHVIKVNIPFESEFRKKEDILKETLKYINNNDEQIDNN